MPAHFKRKQIEFIKAYTTPRQPGFRNAAESARIAGYSAKSSGGSGYILLRHPRIAAEVKKRLDEYDSALQSLSDITKEEYLQIANTSMREVGPKHSNFCKLMEIIGKVKGFFNEQPSTQIMIYNEASELESKQPVSEKALKSRIANLLLRHKPKTIEIQSQSTT